MVFAEVPETRVQHTPQLAVPGADVNGPQVSALVLYITDGLAAVAVTGPYAWRAYPVAVAYSLIVAPAIVVSVDWSTPDWADVEMAM